MTDRELLELAAKAAGCEIVGDVSRLIAQPGHYSGGFVIRNDKGGDSLWNPLEDDGDALRLAVRLGCDFSIDNDEDMEVTVQARKGKIVWERFADHADKNAATRRAIVRAAAAMAKEEGK